MTIFIFFDKGNGCLSFNKAKMYQLMNNIQTMSNLDKLIKECLLNKEYISNLFELRLNQDILAIINRYALNKFKNKCYLDEMILNVNFR